MREGAETRRRQEAAGNETYVWTTEPHWWPGYHGRYGFRSHETGRALTRAMYELANQLTRRREPPDWSRRHDPLLDCKQPRPTYQGTVQVCVAPNLRDGLNRLDDTIRTALEEAFACGKADGQSIVRQLAAGDMTLKDFEKHLEPQ